MRYLNLNPVDLLEAAADVYLGELDRTTCEELKDHRQAEALLKAVIVILEENNKAFLDHLQQLGAIPRR